MTWKNNNQHNLGGIIMTKTDLPPIKKRKIPTEKASLSLRIPEALYTEIQKELQANKRTVVSLLEEIIDQNASLQDAQVSLASLMSEATAPDKTISGVKMKLMTVPVSSRHYSLARLEAIRQNTKVRSLLNDWFHNRYSGRQTEPDEWPTHATAP